MQKSWYFSMILIAIAIVSGCSSVPQNPSLAQAHSNYNSALTNPQVTNTAALELKEAGNFLDKADAALNKGQGDATVNHLAHMANQQVAIAQETAKAKIAELAVTNASSARDRVLLEARTAEAEEAKRQLEELKAKKTDRGLVITLQDPGARSGASARTSSRWPRRAAAPPPRPAHRSRSSHRHE